MLSCLHPRWINVLISKEVSIIDSVNKLSLTLSAVFQLMISLSYANHQFVLSCDNYSSNIPLFKALREYSIDACRTIRPNSAKYLPVLKFNKHTSRLPWNTLSEVVSTDVLAVVVIVLPGRG